ncbi:hypothetical protein GQ457_01G044550 [Hibiscus cannabinus]
MLLWKRISKFHVVAVETWARIPAATIDYFFPLFGPSNAAVLLFRRSLLLASALWLCLPFPASVKMIDDEQLGFLANFLGIFIFALVIAYHYVTADPKYEGN